RQAGGVLQQLSHRDVVAVDAITADEARQVGLDRRVEVDLAFADELQHDHGGEGFGVAADAYIAVDRHRGLVRQVAQTRRVVTDPSTAVPYGGQGSGVPVVAHQAVELRLYH